MKNEKTYEQKELKITYIGGGSRGWAWNLMADLALEPLLGGEVALYDIDKDAAESNAIIGNHLSNKKETVGIWRYYVADSLREALCGSDFVIISILPGTFDEMESDVHEPEKYGIYQPVGDTVGPGGIMRALRTIPMFVEIAEAIKAYAPDAWVINYTNPMTVCVRTLYQVFPGIKALGCCHEVFGTQALLCNVLEEMEGISGLRRQDINTNVLGINHFTWIDRASYQGMDIFPVYRKYAEKYAVSGCPGQTDKNWMNNSFVSRERVKMDLFLKYGLIAAAGDRHLAEFVPGWYTKDKETVMRWKFGLTTVAWRRQDLEQRLEKSRRLVNGDEEVSLEPSGEEGVLILKALLGMGNLISNVNIPNQGQIANLPSEVVVESNVLFSRNSVAPVFAGSLPETVRHLILRHVVNQEGIIKAALAKDRQQAFLVFMNDPQMRLSFEEGKALFDAMVKNTEKYLEI